MKAKTLFAVVMLALITGGSAVRADGIVGSTSNAGWQPFPGTLNDYSNVFRPYWDQDSPDAVNNNIGNLLSGKPGPNWWGERTPVGANPDINFHFTHDPKAGQTAGLLSFEISGNAAENTVGWYNADNPSEKHELWNGLASPSSGAAATFAPTGNYGFYLEGSLGVYYTESKLNSLSEQARQHFAVFALNLQPGSESWTIGIEDLDAKALATEPAGDYQDFVFTVSSTTLGLPTVAATGVPEPATSTIVGAGILGLLLRRRSRF